MQKEQAHGRKDGIGRLSPGTIVLEFTFNSLCLEVCSHPQDMNSDTCPALTVLKSPLCTERERQTKTDRQADRGRKTDQQRHRESCGNPQMSPASVVFH